MNAEQQVLEQALVDTLETPFFSNIVDPLAIDTDIEEDLSSDTLDSNNIDNALEKLKEINDIAPEAGELLLSLKQGQSELNQVYHQPFELSDFTIKSPVAHARDKDGIYTDRNEAAWSILEGSSKRLQVGDEWKYTYYPESVLVKYIAGGLYQLFLGENAPHTEIVIDNIEHKFLTATEILPNFMSLRECPQYKFSYSFDEGPNTFNNIPLTEIPGFLDVISASNFLNDYKWSSSKYGFIDHGNSYSFSLIDPDYHDKHFILDSLSLDNFYNEFTTGYKFASLEEVGFDAFYQSISRIANLDFSAIEDTVANKVSHIKTYMETLGLTSLYSYSEQNGDLAKNLYDYQISLNTHLKQQHEHYQKICHFMNFEKAIVDGDSLKVIDLVQQGFNLDEPFKPFFNAMTISTYDGWEIIKEVTGNELLQKSGLSLDDILVLDNNPPNELAQPIHISIHQIEQHLEPVPIHLEL